MLNRILVATLFLSTLNSSAFSQCLGGTIAWVSPASPPAGTLQAGGKILGTVNVTARSQGSFAAGRPIYSTNFYTWAGFNFQSLVVIRGLSFGASGNYTYFKLATPLDSNYVHLLVKDIRGDGVNTEHQRVLGYLNGVPVTPTFKDPQNGATITGGNIITGWSGTTSAIQSSMREFFNGPVDSIVIKATGISDYIISELVARCDIVLPFKLNSFTAKQFDKKIILTWEAASESGFDHYDIERSSDGFHWDKIGEQILSERKNGMAVYHFDDLGPMDGKNYYRLKSQEKTGGFTFSNVVVVNFKMTGATTDVMIYPNPFRNNISIRLSKPEEKISSIKIYNSQGQIIKNIQTLPSNLPISTQGWSIGIYLIEITTERGNRLIQKLVKN